MAGVLSSSSPTNSVAPALFALAVTLILLKLVNSIQRYRKRRWYALNHGCRPVQHVRKHKIPGGFDLMRRTMAADKRNQVPEELIKIYEEQGNKERHGRVNTWLEWQLGKPVLYTVECKNIQALTATQSADYGAGDLRQKIYGPFIGHGIFALDGAKWEHTRGMIRPSFARALVADLELEESHVQDMFNLFKTDTTGWTSSVDLQPILLRLTLDSATEFLFGESLDSQKVADPGSISPPKSFSFDIAAVADAFDGAMYGLGQRMRLGEFYFLFRSPEWKRHIKLSHAFTDFYVAQALEKSTKHEADDSKKLRLLNDLIQTSSDPKVLREQVLTVIVAGRDTTAGLLGWTFWLLARHPEEYEKLRQIVIKTFGAYDDPVTSFESLKRCQYLQWTLSEAGRLFPVVPTNQRRSLRDTTLPLGGGPDGRSPLFVEKGTEILFPHHILHRRKDLWGDDADEFKPARWMNRRFAWDFIPFSAGSRICLGQQFALTEAAYVLVRILQKYDRVESTDPAGMEAFHSFTVTTTPREMLVRLHEASV